MNAPVAPHVFEGEILGPKDTVTVIFAANALGESRSTIHAPAGSTVSDIVNVVVGQMKTPGMVQKYHVTLSDGSAIREERWHQVRPKPGTVIVIMPRPEFSALIGAITAAVGAISSLIAAGGFIGKLIMSAIMFGVKLLLNKLFAPKEPKRVEQSEPKVSYSVIGSRNQALPGQAIPVVLGKMRFAPPFLALPYTESVGFDQYCRILVGVYGRCSIAEIKAGEVTASALKGVTIQQREGTSSDLNTSLYPLAVVEFPLTVSILHSAGWQQQTTADNIHQFSLDYTFLNGIYTLNDQGERRAVRVEIQLRYRKVGTVPWTTHGTMVIWVATADTVRRTHFVTPAAGVGQYEVAINKLTADATDTRTVDDGVWTSLRGFRNGEPVKFPHPLCAIAVRVKGSGQLSGTLDTLNAIFWSKVKSWNGTTWVPDTTSNSPADLFRHVLQGVANARAVPDSLIDLPALQSWKQYCAAQGFRYNKVQTQQQSVYDMLREVAAAGRAMVIFKDGKWSVVWDEQNPAVVAMIDPRNSWGFEGNQNFDIRPHAYRVGFVNELKKYAEDERTVYDDGYNVTNATIIEGLELPGVTHPDQIYKHARFLLAQNRLRPAVYTVNVDWEGLRLIRNDRVRVTYDTFLIGSGSGRVVEVDATVGAQTITIDDTIIFDSTKSYVVRFRLEDDTFVLRSVVPGTGGELAVIPLLATTTLPAKGDLMTAGVADNDSGVFRVLKSEPQNEFVHRLSLVDDAPDIYLADTGTIPEFDSNVTEPPDPYLVVPRNINVLGGAFEEGGVFFEYMTVSWTLDRLAGVASVEAQYRRVDELEEDDWRPMEVVAGTITSATVRKIPSGLYNVQVRTLFADGTYSGWADADVFSATALSHVPDDVATFRIDTVGDLSTLSWGQVSGVGITYEIRFAPSTTPSPAWNSAVPLFPSVSGTSVQAQTMVGTYFIKAKLPTGLASTNATMLESSVQQLAGLNLVVTLDESTGGFTGTKTNVEVIDGELRLGYRNVMNNWATLNDVTNLLVGDGDIDSRGLWVSGYYYFANSIDLGQVYTSRMTATVDAYGLALSDLMSAWTSLADVLALDASQASDWRVEIEYRSTQVDPALNIWSAWQPFVLSDISARALQFRIKLSGRQTEDPDAVYSLTTPSVRGLFVNVDMPDRDLVGKDVVSSPAGTTITFSPPYKFLSNVLVDGQDMATTDYKTITAKSVNGFTVRFFNTSGVGVSRTFDWRAKGYGEVIT